VIRTLAGPAVNSTPSFSFFDALDFPNVLPALSDRPPAKSASEQANSDVSNDSCHFNPPGSEEKRRTLKLVSYPCRYDTAL
jgi:hypothetical protein